MTVAQQPATQHVDAPPLSDAQIEANAVAKEVSERDAAIAAAHAEFQKDVQVANEKRLKVLAQYPDTSIAGIAATAWNNVRGADPAFNECILSHREKLLTHAEAVQRTGVPTENPSDFEIEVGRLLAAVPPVK